MRLTYERLIWCTDPDDDADWNIIDGTMDNSVDIAVVDGGPATCSRPEAPSRLSEAAYESAPT
jgi:hypothetical protein